MHGDTIASVGLMKYCLQWQRKREGGEGKGWRKKWGAEFLVHLLLFQERLFELVLGCRPFLLRRPAHHGDGLG